MTHQIQETLTGAASGIGGGFAGYHLLNINLLPALGPWGEFATASVMAITSGALGYLGIQIAKAIHKKFKG